MLILMLMLQLRRLYSPAGLLISMRGHWEAEQTVPVALVHHGVLRVEIEGVDRGGGEPGEGETQHHHRHRHDHWGWGQSGCQPVVSPSHYNNRSGLSLLSLLAVSCSGLLRLALRSGEESRAICGNNTDTWGGGGFTPLLSGLKIQTEILNYVKEATLAVWQPRVICMQTFWLWFVTLKIVNSLNRNVAPFEFLQSGTVSVCLRLHHSGPVCHSHQNQTLNCRNLTTL